MLIFRKDCFIFD